jgi:hypothetical protein
MPRCQLDPIERVGWGDPAQHPPGTVVEFGGDGVELLLGEAARVSGFVQILAQQSVGVLVGAALPGMVRVSSRLAATKPANSVLPASLLTFGRRALSNAAASAASARYA